MPKITFIHTSPAAIAPLAKYFKAHGPAYEIINLLDDGLLQFFKENNEAAVINRLSEMIGTAEKMYGARLAMITCSSVSVPQLEKIRQQVNIPLIKVDIPMAEMAVEAGEKIGLAVTFPPGEKHATQLILDKAAEKGKKVQIMPIIVPEAYDALLGGEPDKHNELLLSALREKSGEADVIVLSQVSMAGLQNQAEDITGKKVFSSPAASLVAINNQIQNST